MVSFLLQKTNLDLANQAGAIRMLYSKVTLFSRVFCESFKQFIVILEALLESEHKVGSSQWWVLMPFPRPHA